MDAQGDIAVIGLAVMGQNLILNMNDHGFTVVAFNRTVSKVDEFLSNEAKGSKVIGAHSLEEMVKLLKRPRRVMLMVKAGKPVDEFIEHLLPLLEPGDIIIDGGNSLFEDTTRRPSTSSRRGCFTSEPECLVVKKGHAMAQASCPGFTAGLASREGHFPRHRCEGGRRHAVL
jgi:6-phosphogluconate dehydrogenase